MRFLLLLSLVLVVLAACSPEPPSGPPILNGREGVTITATDFPREIFEDEEFPVTFELENRGITKVAKDDPGMMFWSFDSLYLTHLRVLSNMPDGLFSLEPRTIYTEGETTFITGYFRANEIQRNSVQADTTIRLSVCYPYQSNVTTQVCLEQLRQPQSGMIACRASPVHPDSPGAPIGVREVETRTRHIELPNGTLGVAPQFRITLENYGEGIPSVSDAYGLGCEDKDAQLQVVRLRAFLLDEELECDVDGGPVDVRFTRALGRSEGFVACSLPEDSALVRGQGNFLSLLTLDMEYDYRDSEQVEMVILRD